MKIKVKGMHCDACKALIKMELEEVGLDKVVSSIELIGNDIGVLTLEDASEEDKTKIEELINNMDQYSVIQE